MAGARKIYRLFLKFYPAGFREKYQAELERQFWDDYRNERGNWARVAFCLHAVRDLAVSIPTEALREMRQDVHCAARLYCRRQADSRADGLGRTVVRYLTRDSGRSLDRPEVGMRGILNASRLVAAELWDRGPISLRSRRKARSPAMITAKCRHDFL